MPMTINVREALPGDLPEVLELVKELARYERAEGEVEVTLEQMLAWGSGVAPAFGCFVLELDERVIGAAIYYYKYSTWKGRCFFLEDIVVKETYRNQGYGRRLFDAVAQLAKREGVKRLEWQVLEWNAPAISFYRKLGSSFDGEWINCRLTYDQLQSF